MVPVAIRYVLTAGLIGVVADHAHWSVTLMLTLSAINAEATALVVKRLWQRLYGTGK